MKIELTNQKMQSDTITPKLLLLKNMMNSRKEMWLKVPYSDKKKWVKSDKDPIMTLAFSIYKYLHNNFFGPKFYDEGEYGNL